MIFLVHKVILIALLTAFVLALMKKWNVIEWLQVHAPSETLYKLFSCPFCLSWWTGLVISAVAAFVTRDSVLVFVPLFSTVIAVRLW